MIITGGPRKHRGRTARLHQFCNDWFSVELVPDEAHESQEAAILSPTMVRLTGEEVEAIRAAGDRVGTLWAEFALIEPANPADPQQGYRFRRIASLRGSGRHRGPT
jgi:hypothetical protein